MYYAVFDVSGNWFGALSTARGLKYLTLPMSSSAAALDALAPPPEAQEDSSRFIDLIQQLKRYFNGEAVVFDIPLDLEGGTPFQRRVRQAARDIPRGETRSYGQLAEIAGSPRAARAVGQVMARNPVPLIIPCHRVLATDGGLGGFGGGLEMKRLLLALER